MSDDIRDVGGRVFDEELTEEWFRDLAQQIKGASKTEYVACRKCGVKTPAPVPDIRAIADTLDKLMSHFKGKPAQTVRHDVNVSVEVGSVNDLSLDEIRARKAAILARRPELAGPPDAA